MSFQFRYALKCMEAHPAGSGVKAGLPCDGEFSCSSILGYSSVQVVGSHLEKWTELKKWEEIKEAF